MPTEQRMRRKCMHFFAAALLGVCVGGCGRGTPPEDAAEQPSAAVLEQSQPDDPKATDPQGRTGLQIAAVKGDAAAVRALAARGADIGAQTPAGNTALHLAVQSGVSRTVESLLQAGASASGKAKGGYTPLHFACLPLDRPDGGVVERRIIARLLLRHKAVIDAAADDGRTPLHVAAAWGDEEMTDFLIREGARKDIRDLRGKTAASVARDAGHEKLAALLE